MKVVKAVLKKSKMTLVGRDIEDLTKDIGKMKLVFEPSQVSTSQWRCVALGQSSWLAMAYCIACTLPGYHTLHICWMNLCNIQSGHEMLVSKPLLDERLPVVFCGLDGKHSRRFIVSGFDFASARV